MLLYMPLWPAIRRPSHAVILAEVTATSPSDRIRAKLTAAADRAQAIVDLAADEDRELTADEKTEIDAILGIGTPGEDGYKAGEIDALEKDLERAEKLEARQAELAQGRAGGGLFSRADQPRRHPTNDEQPQVRAAGVRIPAQAAYRHKSLKAFRGPHAEQAAYLSGMFLLATLCRNERAAQFCKDNGLDIRGAQSTTTDSKGGFLVPSELEQAIVDLREERGVFRRESRIVPMGSDTLEVPRRSGGLTAYFVSDNTEITASDKSWDSVTLTARKLAALVKYSSELSEDAVISIAEDLASEIAYAFADKEDNCGFLGDGTSTYGHITGVVNAVAAGSIHTALTGNTSFGTLDLVDFEAMVGKLPQYAEANAKWFISKAGWANSMLRLAEAAGGNTTREIEAGGGRQFLGYPVVISQVLNSTLTAQTSTNGLCFFGDLRLASMMGSRRGISIMGSNDRYFEFDQLAIKGTERFDINVHERGTATAAGAILSLKTPAS